MKRSRELIQEEIRRLGEGDDSRENRHVKKVRFIREAMSRVHSPWNVGDSDGERWPRR